MRTNEAKICKSKVVSRMQRRILGGGLGVLFIIATVVTLVVIRGTPSEANPALRVQGKHSPTPCLSTDRNRCPISVQSHGSGTVIPSPTPTQITPPPPA